MPVDRVVAEVGGATDKPTPERWIRLIENLLWRRIPMNQTRLFAPELFGILNRLPVEIPMNAASVLVVPPFTLHRTVNVGPEALVYVGVYPAAAGHDYAAVESRGFVQVALADASAATCGLQGVRVTRRNQ